MCLFAGMFVPVRQFVRQPRAGQAGAALASEAFGDESIAKSDAVRALAARTRFCLTGLSQANQLGARLAR
jgi:hypothetical protein